MPNMEQVELILSNVLLALQLCLGLWQFIKLSPVGALIKGFVGWSLRPLRLSPTYTLLQGCRGRVFKKVRCYVLQADLLSQRRDIQAVRRNTIKLYYLGSRFILERRGSVERSVERRGSEMNMLFINGVMCYYITPQIWEQLDRLSNALNVDIVSKYFYDDADADAADAADAAVAADDAALAASSSDFAASYAAVAAAAAAVAAADTADAAYDAAAALGAVPYALYVSVFLRGHREFWEAMSTGGVMRLDEVLDEIILDNKHVGAPLNDDWLLPVNLSVSEEKLLKIINLLGLFLQTKKVKVHWLIPTSLSFISALMEFSTIIRVWLYEHINLFFCYLMHFICDPFPRSCRRQVYSFGKWVENLKPCNDIELRVVRGNICATIGGGAKAGKRGATLVAWLNVADEAERIVRVFNLMNIHIKCIYYERRNKCRISAPTITEFGFNCNSRTEFEHLITFVSCIAKNSCGSLKCCGPGNKVSVRGFRESVISYVKNGFPKVYELELSNVVVA